VRDSPILLLDEPTAALDSESEKLVIEALERLMKGRTVITIAHRLTTIRDADKIIVIDGGVVAESGTHDQLMTLNGIYADLHRTQFDEASMKASINDLPMLPRRRFFRERPYVSFSSGSARRFRTAHTRCDPSCQGISAD
jgi:ABC-type multidrug transport system ATPase subunit